MGELRVGLAGCGEVAQRVHLRLLARLPGARLVALAEPDPARRRSAGRRVAGVALLEDYCQLLEMADVDAVVICLPNALHARAAEAALERGKHVYLEKPLATSLEGAHRVLAAWRRSGAAAMVGFNYRYNPLWQGLRRAVLSGQAGELASAHSVFSTVAAGLPAWRRSRQGGGGVLLDLASHHVDLVRYLFAEEVSEVWAALRTQQWEDDSVALCLRLAGGLLVQSFFSWSSIEEDRFEVYGRAGRLAVDRYASTCVEFRGCHPSRLDALKRRAAAMLSSRYLLRKLRAPAGEPSYRAALARFVAAARGEASATPDPADGYRSLAVVLAAEESASSGRSVRPADFVPPSPTSAVAC